jgi:ribosome-binding protein aMBF1 (putative translation factor)
MLRTLPPKSKLEKNVDIVIDRLRRRKRLGRSESTVRLLVKDDLKSGSSVQHIIAERIGEYERARKREHVPKALRGTASEPSAASWRAIISRRMRECGWSCYGLADACGVNRSVLHRFVHGETSFTLDTAEKVCALLHLRLVPAEKLRKSSSKGAVNQVHNGVPRLRQRGVTK